jgi:pyruvate carboxylase
VFWGFDEKGKMEISAYRFKLYLESLNYFKYYPTEKTKTFIFVKKENNFIDIITEFQIKDEILCNLVSSNNIDAFDVAAEKLTMFTPKYLSIVDTADVSIDKDGSDFAMIYYENLALKIKKDSIEKINYEDMQTVVKNPEIYMLINTLPVDNQDCLIATTVSVEKEEAALQMQNQVVV